MRKKKTIGVNPYDKEKYPNVYRGHNYALKVVNGDIISSKYIMGACQRYLDDLKPNNKWYFDPEKAEKYLRLVQKFPHVKGKWPTPNIEYADWQCFIFMNIMGFISKITNERRFRTAHVEVPRGSGKAHPLYQIVPTPEGFKNWEDIKVGSNLYTRDGSVCTVIGKTPITNQPLFRVHFSDGSYVDCSGEHEWVTSNKIERERKVRHRKNPPTRKDSIRLYESSKETSEIFNTLKVRGESNHSVALSCAIEKGEMESTSIPPYLLGLWLGDGSSHSALLTINSEDKEYLETKLHSDGVQFKIKKYPDGRNAYEFRLYDIYQKLKSETLLGDKKFLHKWIFESVEFRTELLRGLIDSDGSVEKNGQAVFYSCNDSLAKGFKKLAE
jgi:hypothetical protein